MGSSNGGGGVPPGFRFHPTDEELLHYYLKKKVSFQKFDMEVIREVDLNKIEPWELQERCKIGSSPQNEWYFFSHKDRKYPTGSRTNRATNAGFWKATGRDKCIRNTFKKIGMRKTLVFYRGRAPHGQKTDWIMHEYRLEDHPHPHHLDHTDTSQPNPPALNEDGWVVCRVFKKKNLFKVGNEGGGGGGGGGTVNSDHHHHHHHHHLNNNSNSSNLASITSGAAAAATAYAQPQRGENHHNNYLLHQQYYPHHHHHGIGLTSYSHDHNIPAHVMPTTPSNILGGSGGVLPTHPPHPIIFSSNSHHLQAQNFIPTHEPPLGRGSASAAGDYHEDHYSALAPESALVPIMQLQIKQLVAGNPTTTTTAAAVAARDRDHQCESGSTDHDNNNTSNTHDLLDAAAAAGANKYNHHDQRVAGGLEVGTNYNINICEAAAGGRRDHDQHHWVAAAGMIDHRMATTCHKHQLEEHDEDDDEARPDSNDDSLPSSSNNIGSNINHHNHINQISSLPAEMDFWGYDAK